MFEFASVVVNDKRELSILWINQIVKVKRKAYYYLADQAKNKSFSESVLKNDR